MSKSVETLCEGAPDLDFKTGEAEGLVPGVVQQRDKRNIGSRGEGILYVMTKEELDRYISEKLPIWIKEIRQSGIAESRIEIAKKRRRKQLIQDERFCRKRSTY